MIYREGTQLSKRSDQTTICGEHTAWEVPPHQAAWFGDLEETLRRLKKTSAQGGLSFEEGIWKVNL